MSMLSRIRSLFQGGKLNVRGRFELLHEAISGTMSVFYAARDRHTNQIVGLKILNPEKTALFEARFKGLTKPSEGKIASSIVADHVVRTFEHGFTTKGEQYLVMEFLDGPVLNTMIKDQSPILENKRLSLIRQMIRSVGEVHESGFLHRDICPRNFMSSKDVSQLKLIDFGLSLPATKQFMQPGNRTGTPNYMAPEILRRRTTDHRVDIFALGVSIYQLCAFHLPWRGHDSSGRAAVLHDTQEPVDILIHRPRLNKTLAHTIMRCLLTNPADRPDSAKDLIRLVSRVRSEEE